ncbi:hypothetical protein [Rhizobium sullae]|uniref:hypothetical protein n=1 Tax=Rhizobium sullae TaxID=50338 RepID=UPI001FD2BB76|nr:hypothetical protein [Rhizobium sullae]
MDVKVFVGATMLTGVAIPLKNIAPYGLPVWAALVDAASVLPVRGDVTFPVYVAAFSCAEFAAAHPSRYDAFKAIELLAATDANESQSRFTKLFFVGFVLALF